MKYRVAAIAGLGLVFAAALMCPAFDAPAKKKAPNEDRPIILDNSVQPRVHAGAEGFSILLETEFALENGPVVYRIRLENRTANPADCFRHTHNSSVRLTQTPEWIRKPRPGVLVQNILGHYGPLNEKIDGGKHATELIVVHDWYQRIPPGRAVVGFEWDVVGAERHSWRVSPLSSKYKSFNDEPINNREPVCGHQIVKVQPATPANIASVKEKLELHMREAVGNVRPMRRVIQCLVGSRHPELVPLMIRAIQLGENHEARDLLRTIYDCFPDPNAGFDAVFPLLKAVDPVCTQLIEFWEFQAAEYVNHLMKLGVAADLKLGKRQFQGGDDRTEVVRTRTLADLQVWNESRIHPNSRLTIEQHARIQSLENVWVRAAYYQRFAEWCSPYWVLSLFADLRRLVSPLDDKTVEPIYRGLIHDRFAVREKAMADAMKLDERVVMALRERHKRQPTAELDQRINLIARSFEKNQIPPLGARVIEAAMYSGTFQGELIFQALSAPPGSCRLADVVRSKLTEQQKRRTERLEWERKNRAAGVRK